MTDPNLLPTECSIEPFERVDDLVFGDNGHV